MSASCVSPAEVLMTLTNSAGIPFPRHDGKTLLRPHAYSG